MTSVPPVSWQRSLFDPYGEPVGVDGGRPDLSFDRLIRHRLDDWSWVDEVPGWLADHAEMFELLLWHAPWQQRERWMYERRVLEPRMVAAWSGEALASLPPRLEQVRAVLSERYGVEFDSVLVNLYRDGRDGVAWHGDSIRLTMTHPLVATVSLGERRRFLLRRGRSGRPSQRFIPGEGDLLVMGGACQHEWQHTVPKAARAGARMSVTLRHSRPGRASSTAPHSTLER
jgi:alkylated DNA repair dioxygenase AlkB